MKSSKLVSVVRPYCRRNSLKRGTPCSRSRMRSSAGTSICFVGLFAAAAIGRFCRNSGWLPSVSAPSRCRPIVSAQFGRPSLCFGAASPCARNVETIGIFALDPIGSF